MNSKITLITLFLVLALLCWRQPIFKREIPIDRKQISEDTYFVYFKDGGVMTVRGNFLAVKRRIGTKWFGFLEVME